MTINEETCNTFLSLLTHEKNYSNIHSEKLKKNETQ